MICKNCLETYVSRNGVLEFTRYICEGCGEHRIHPNKKVPKLCPECSDEYETCQFCGKDID